MFTLEMVLKSFSRIFRHQPGKRIDQTNNPSSHSTENVVSIYLRTSLKRERANGEIFTNQYDIAENGNLGEQRSMQYFRPMKKIAHLFLSQRSQ